MGINGIAVLSELSGIPCHHLHEQQSSKKNIMSSRSFSIPIQQLPPIANALAN
ncbi:MAG: hypothetical protein QM479_13290 [Pseudomonadota bacterium]